LTTDITPQNFTSAQSAQTPFSLNTGKPISFHQGIPLEITQLPAEPPQVQSAPLPQSNNIAPTSIAHSVPAEHFETNLTAHIKEKTWPQQFGEKVVWMTKTDVQSAQISLNPPNG
jgi:flagellar hook-length control protein FliK